MYSFWRFTKKHLLFIYPLWFNIYDLYVEIEAGPFSGNGFHSFGIKIFVWLLALLGTLFAPLPNNLLIKLGLGIMLYIAGIESIMPNPNFINKLLGNGAKSVPSSASSHTKIL